jgi:uncharacterized protein (UPF0210 family)
MSDPSRRDFLGAMTTLPLWPGLLTRPGRFAASPQRLRIRTVTAGLTISALPDPAVEAALAFLDRGRRFFEEAGYEVQTVRLATAALPFVATAETRRKSLAQLQALDELVGAHGTLVSIGPVALDDSETSDVGPWVAELIGSTRNLSCSIAVARPSTGESPTAISAAAAAIQELSRTTPAGLGNFRFAAAANVPAGTPFFPVAYHEGSPAFSLGLESAGLVGEAFRSAADPAAARERLRLLLDSELSRVERLALELAAREPRRYLGIDASPAPGLDRSIGEAIEALTGRPFGSPATLSACALVTDVLHGLAVKTCGYSGLMLPVLEDPALARRAAEGTFGVSELLLYSSVCGTGLDVVPLPGDASVERLAAVIGDVAALAVKWGKPLSARLLPVPGAAAGGGAHFDDPRLTDSVAMGIE